MKINIDLFWEYKQIREFNMYYVCRFYKTFSIFN